MNRRGLPLTADATAAGILTAVAAVMIAGFVLGVAHLPVSPWLLALLSALGAHRRLSRTPDDPCRLIGETERLGSDPVTASAVGVRRLGSDPKVGPWFAFRGLTPIEAP